MNPAKKLPNLRRTTASIAIDVNARTVDEPVIEMQRYFDAPREVVWDALTDPKQVALWYGGYGFENPVCEMDVRPGGRWRHVMRTPDGAEFASEFIFDEVRRPERLVWRTAGTALPAKGPHNNVMCVTLEDAGSRTLWKLVVRFASFEDREAAMGIGFTTVLSEGTEKLNELVTRH